MAENHGTASTPGFLRSLLGGLLAALVLLSIWLPLHQPTPPLPTADIYTHASVARHLASGDGFLTDVVYPLSFAFPFARELPQPLLHRGPGFSLVLVGPYLAAGGDPQATLTAIRWLQVGILGLIALTGAAAFLRHRRQVNIGPWLIFLAANPLLVYAVDWGFEELLCSWILLVLWLRIRFRPAPGWGDGLLAGILLLFRLDLCWVPVLWWLWFARERQVLRERENAPTVSPWRGLILAFVLLLLVQVPWSVRNFRLTGNPVFTLQGQAELVKDTRTWPDYSVYKHLVPQPPAVVLAGDPVPLLRKVARGLEFYALHLRRLLPVPYLVLCALLLVVLIRGKITHQPCPFRPGREHPMSILEEDSALGPLTAAASTTLLLAVQYCFFDASLRHLLPLLPVLLWEISPLTGDLALNLVADRLPAGLARRHPAAWLAVAAVITLAVIRISWVPLAGWAHARHQAQAQAPLVAAQVEAFRNSPPRTIFVPNSAVPWFANRPGIWDPQDDQVRRTIEEWLTD